MMTCPLIAMKRFTILLCLIQNLPGNSFRANFIKGYFVIFNTNVRYLFNIIRFAIISELPSKSKPSKPIGIEGFS